MLDLPLKTLHIGNWKEYVLLPTCNILDLNQIERYSGWMCWNVVTLSGLVVSLSCFLKQAVFQLQIKII